VTAPGLSSDRPADAARSLAISRSHLWIIGLAIAVRLAFAFAFPTGGGDWDMYSTVAENILRGCGVSLSPPDGAECVPHFGGNHLPGYPAFVALVWRLSAQSDMAVRVVQVLLYALALLRLMVATERYAGSRPALIVGLVMALSPLQTAWPRYTQTETLTLAAVIWVFAELMASFAERRLRVAPIALGIVVATFLRHDGILLCIPVAIAGFLIHPPLETIRRGVWVALIVALPLAAWTVRNIAVGLPSLLPIGMVLPKGAPTPYGYIQWGSTWISEEYQRMGWAWPVNRLKYRGIDIDNRAFDSLEEKERVTSWLKELAQYEDRPFPPEIDARFAELARERAAREPWRTYIVLPALRSLALWKNPFSSFGWPNEMPSVGHQERLEASRGSARLWEIAREYPLRAATKAITAGYRFLLIGGFIVVILLSFSPRLREERKIIWSVTAWVIVRTLFFAFTNNVETRYTLPPVPAMELATVLGFLALFERSYRRKARGGVTAPSVS
jgi:hypothetical protein